MGHHSSASGSRLLDLDGLEVVSAELVGGEWQLVVQTTAMVIGCAGCGVPATPHGRREVRVRDLPIGGPPVVLVWRKRLWRCREPACSVRTWTERTPAIRPRAVLTERARAEACRRVGKDAHAVAAVARDLGVGWQTVMWAPPGWSPGRSGTPSRRASCPPTVRPRRRSPDAAQTALRCRPSLSRWPGRCGPRCVRRGWPPTTTRPRHGQALGAVIGFALAWEGQEHGALWITGDTVLYDGVRQVADRSRSAPPCSISDACASRSPGRCATA